MNVQVTLEDIVRAGRSGGDNPISRALLRATGQAWVVFGGSMAYSRTSPHHSHALPFEVSQKWRAWHWEPFEFEVQWHHIGPATRSERRSRQRRSAPRFGFDRRARDRRARNRRRTERRTTHSHTSYERRGVQRRGHDVIAVEVTAETSGGAATIVETRGGKG
jgi:hypothetical protein